jgi:hypothetical protein
MTAFSIGLEGLKINYQRRNWGVLRGSGNLDLGSSG